MGTTRVSRVQLGVPPSCRTSPRLRTPTASAKSAHVRTFGETPKATRETRVLPVRSARPNARANTNAFANRDLEALRQKMNGRILNGRR